MYNGAGKKLFPYFWYAFNSNLYEFDNTDNFFHITSNLS